MMKLAADDSLQHSGHLYKRLRISHLQDPYIPLVRCDENVPSPACVNNSICTCSSQHNFPYNSCMLGCCSSSQLCDNVSQRFYSSSSTLIRRSSNAPLLRSVSSSSEEDMNVNSPDSGFESIPTPRSDVADFTDDELLNSPSTPRPPSPKPLNLLPAPPKPVPKVEIQVPVIVCKWKDCSCTFSSNELLQDHVGTLHVEPTVDRFSCLWIGCRHYDKPARSIKWLRTHVASHTGKKRFQCVLEGCGVSYNTPQGLERHVLSHFSETNIPKARVAGSTERKCLVKKRRIRDKTKALANIHDLMDPRCVGLMQKYLVQKAENARRKSNLAQVTCKRKHEDGSLWFLSSNQQWSRDNCANKYPTDESPFFSRPTKRCRKYKATS